MVRLKDDRFTYLGRMPGSQREVLIIRMFFSVKKTMEKSI
jgi:hypothetical protein